MKSVTSRHDPDQLAGNWRSLLESEPRLRIRDAAQHLHVSEAELLATGCGSGVTRLRPEVGIILAQLGGLGRVMGLTRNEHAVLERKGHYLNLQTEPHASLFLGEDIDMRMFTRKWAHVFASVEDAGQGRTKRSIQFFDAAGTAMHKVFLLEDSNLDAFERLVQEQRAPDQGRTLAVTAQPGAAAEGADDGVDVEALRQDWSDLQDTHDFHWLMGKHGVSRTQAFRLVGEPYARPVANTTHRDVLEKASASGLAIMVFVGNHGCIQIHTGPVDKVVPFKGWFNVMDPDLNLHLLESGVHTSWVVLKPTRDGIVTSVELYDPEGGQIVTFFGKRKPGIPELEEWRRLVAALPVVDPQVA